MLRVTIVKKMNMMGHGDDKYGDNNDNMKRRRMVMVMRMMMSIYRLGKMRGYVTCSESNG